MTLDMPVLLNTFKTSLASGEGIGSDFKQKIIIEAGAGIVPIGGIIAWFKSFTGVPSLAEQDLSALFLECDGSVIADPDSPLDGQTLPNLNASKFLRGGTTSGGTGGADTFTIGVAFQSLGGSGTTGMWQGTGETVVDTVPAFVNVVWIMRIK